MKKKFVLYLQNSKEIIGQDQAIETITRSILQVKLGINKK